MFLIKKICIISLSLLAIYHLMMNSIDTQKLYLIMLEEKKIDQKIKQIKYDLQNINDIDEIEKQAWKQYLMCKNDNTIVISYKK